MVMIAPPDMPPLPRPSRSCADCIHVETSATGLRCLYGAMVNRASDNRSVRGLCGTAGHMWRIRNDA